MHEQRKKLEVIPAIDLLDGAIVRLFQGDFDQVTQYVRDPLELAKQYADTGVRRLHVVDLNGAKTGEPTNLPIIESLAAAGLEIQAGGGIRDLTRLNALFDAGVSRGVIGSLAVENRNEVARWMSTVGAERIILAVDVRLGENHEPEVLTRGWQNSSGELLWPLVDYYLERGATEFLCTDIARDGTLQGPNLQLYEACTTLFPHAEFIASGGVSNLADLEALDQSGLVVEVLPNRLPLVAAVTTLLAHTRFLEIALFHHLHHGEHLAVVRGFAHVGPAPEDAGYSHLVTRGHPRPDIVGTEALGRDRKSVGSGTSVDLGGGRVIKKKK